MGEAEVSRRDIAEADLVETDVQLRNPSIVLSVRLDHGVARELNRAAQRRGVRISDLLREAVVWYVQSGAGAPQARFLLDSNVARISVGDWPTTAQGLLATPTQPEPIEWGKAAFVKG